MAKKPKQKPVSKEEFEGILATESGATVALIPKHLPDWALKANILSMLFCTIYDGPKDRDTEEVNLAGGRLTVLRYDPDDVLRGFPVNKDVHVYTCSSLDTYLRIGPLRKDKKHHWMPFIFKEYKNWPKKK